MELDAWKGGTEAADPPRDHVQIVDEKRRIAGLGDERVDRAAADQQLPVPADEVGRYRSHRLAQRIISLFRSSRSSLPLGLFGISSRQRIGPGCIKFGNSRLKWSRSSASASCPCGGCGRTIRAIASPSRSSGTPSATASATRPLATAASSTSVGLTLLPLVLIIASSRPTK